MATKIAVAVLHCAIGQWNIIIQRANKIRDNLYGNAMLYATPKVPAVEYNDQLAKANTTQAAAMGGGVDETALRDQEVGLLFGMLQQLVLYVNGLYKGNKVSLLASGFDVVDQYEVQGAPSVPVVNRLVAGKEPNSAKFYIAKAAGTPGIKKPSVTYILQMSYDPTSEESYKTIVITNSRYKLIATGLQRGVEVNFRLAAKNSRGQSDWTELFPFIPQ